MLILLVAFVSGLTTILAPCIWPLLPIVLSSSATGGRRKPLGITVGVCVSFAIFTLTISYIVRFLPFDPNILRLLSVIIISFLGLSLLIPQLSAISDRVVSRFSNKFLNTPFERSDGFLPGLVTGSALGIVWSPCAGPLLATIAALAATRSLNSEIILVTVAYVLGVGIPLFLFALWGNRIFQKSRFLSSYTGLIQKVAGVIMILAAIAIYTNFDKVIQTKLLNLFPSYSTNLNSVESNALKNFGQNPPVAQTDNLENLGPAPNFVGITTWLNLPPGKQALTMQDLRGKVVLVDFWTYTCINCIRTLPHVTEWYEKYKDKGFVVVGVHTPEFEFEKNTENVKSAIKQYKINYPVAQDNDYKTWNAYQNQYWPAEYLIDAKGNTRHTHFGEGEYDKTEKAIQDLLKEAGVTADMPFSNTADQTPHARITSETYLGSKRSNQEYYLTLEGTWNRQEEYAEAKNGAALNLNFTANKVFLVITPKSKDAKIKVLLDGKAIDSTNSGSDVNDDYIQLDTPRLYNLIDLHGNTGTHLLRLEFESDGAQLFAFTFG